MFLVPGFMEQVFICVYHCLHGMFNSNNGLSSKYARSHKSGIAGSVKLARIGSSG